ncbi:MAG: 3-keto-disaccharide hydrolase [Candidatus Saccharicenans sp.]
MDKKKIAILSEIFIFLIFVLGSSILLARYAQKQSFKEDLGSWAIHDPNRPLPSVVTPGPPLPPVPAPSDAIVIFDGNNLLNWVDAKGQPARWKVEGDYMEVVPGTGNIQTKMGFGSCQLHIEWATPYPPKGSGQDRGNSGVFLMGLYEVQVLDSYENKTYADGMAGAIYGQYPPLVNACRKPGEWQTYDIIFFAPKFDRDGKLLEPARMTVFQNGILIHYNAELTGPTAHKARPPYKSHADRLPLMLQDHNHPVRFRNIWLREL